MAGCRSVLVALTSLAFLADAAGAAHKEQRQFSIIVDGKEAGNLQITTLDQDDNSVYMTASAKVQVQHLFVNYDLAIEGQEWWKDGKLIGLKALCNENGKRCDLTVSVRGEQLSVRVNGMDRLSRADLWPTSYWKLPDARFHNKPVPLLDVESGQERTGQLQYIGLKQLPIANQLVTSYHFRVTGAGNPIDLWFDQHHRLVRREFTESGHKTIVQLVGKK
jgi:uncharacterized protein DUF6134